MFRPLVALVQEKLRAERAAIEGEYREVTKLMDEDADAEIEELKVQMSTIVYLVASPWHDLSTGVSFFVQFALWIKQQATSLYAVSSLVPYCLLYMPAL